MILILILHFYSHNHIKIITYKFTFYSRNVTCLFALFILINLYISLVDEAEIENCKKLHKKS